MSNRAFAETETKLAGATAQVIFLPQYRRTKEAQRFVRGLEIAIPISVMMWALLIGITVAL